MLATYFSLIGVIAILLVLHIFAIVPMQIDRFTFFLVSLLFVLLILPAVTTIKFFDIIQVRRDRRLLEKQITRRKPL